MHFRSFFAGCFCVIGLFSLDARAISITVQERWGGENGVLNAVQTEVGGKLFSVVVPRGWQAMPGADGSTVSLSSSLGESVISLRFFTGEARSLLADTDALRRAANLPVREVTLLEAFPAHSGLGSGNGADFSFVIDGNQMKARIAIIPFDGGYASFALVCSAQNSSAAEQTFGRVLTSFRPTQKRTDEEFAKILKSRDLQQQQTVVKAVAAPPELPPKPLPPPEPPLHAEAPVVVVENSFLQEHQNEFLVCFVGLGLLFVSGRVWIRREREAELRELAGGYLSDGTEVANYKLPDWFSMPKDVQPVLLSGLADEPKSEPSLPDPLRRFFEEVPELLSAMRLVLRDLNGDGTAEDRKNNLTRLQEQLFALQEKANAWSLRPAWQLSSALALLVQCVAKKPNQATASVMRTIAAGVDMLHEVCVPGIRPELVIEPPVKILAVDDDALCRKAVQVALQKANIEPDLAVNGEEAVTRARETTYDMVFMDIQMPGMDGLECCNQIHQTPRNGNVPVVFVTGQSDFNTRAQSRLKGGADLMVKPFLVFELTVKTLLYAMRKRLDASAVLRQVVNSTPRAIFSSAEANALMSVPVVAIPNAKVAEPELRKGNGLTAESFSEAADCIRETREMVERMTISGESAYLRNIHTRVVALTLQARLADFRISVRLASALEGLLERLNKHHKLMTQSALNTIIDALDLLERLPEYERRFASDLPLKVLVVEDEPLARRAVVGALQLALDRPDSAEDGVVASGYAVDRAYDVIFTDVQMPRQDGFEFCQNIRKYGLNKTTPVVFITTHTDTDTQRKARECGGCDFIGKPFLPVEITVKAITLAWEHRLRVIDSADELPVPRAIHTEARAPIAA